MLVKRHITVIIGLLLILTSFFSDVNTLLIKDIDDIEKRELEEKLKGQLKFGKDKLSKLVFDSGQDFDITDVPLNNLFLGNWVNKSLIDNQSIKFSHKPHCPLFILFCSLKVHFC